MLLFYNACHAKREKLLQKPYLPLPELSCIGESQVDTEAAIG